MRGNIRLFVLFLTFSLPLAAQNLVTNGSFPSNISGWSDPTGSDHISWNMTDRNGSGSSGSLWIFAIGGQSQIPAVQCVSTGSLGGSQVDFAGSVRFPSIDDGGGTASVGITFHSSSNCSGGSLGGLTESESGGPSNRNIWFDLSSTDSAPSGVQVPSGTNSVLVKLEVNRTFGSTFSAYFDEVSLTVAAPPSSIDILGPTDVQPGDSRYFAAVGTDCTGSLDFGWSWSAPGAQVSSHLTQPRVLIRFPSTGSYTVSASHPSCGSVSGTHVVSVSNSGARIGVSGLPYMYQPEGTDLGRSAFWVRNWGDEATTITLDQNGDFYTQSPGSFTLQPGETQMVQLEGEVEPLGLYRGRSFVLGNGVPSSLDQGLLVRLFVFDPDDPYGQAEPLENRIDTTEEGQLIIPFRNPDPFSNVIGYLVSDAPWIIPPEETITIPAGATENVAVTIDRSLRPDATSPLGSVFGSVRFTSPESTAALKDGAVAPLANENASTSLVTIVDTSPPPSAVEGIPALGAGEVALFIPGAGHVVGSVGTFISDLSIVNRDLFSPIQSLDLFFNPMPGSSGPGSQKSSLSSIAANGTLVLADLVSTVYGQDAQLGSLQIRSSGIENVGVTATVFNKSDPAGTFGTTIPVFRSDRDAPPGQRIYLTGLAKTDSRHTNLFLQETSGAPVLVETRFLDESGTVLSTRSDVVDPFAMVQLGDVAPAGAVSAVLENAGATGEFVAYATPVDRLSGDTWAVSDWPRQLGYTRSEAVVIPVAGALRGANDTFFRTDVAILSTGSIAARGTLRYFDRNGPIFEEAIEIAPGNTMVLDNITETLFEISGDTVGHMTFTPTAGEVVITSRNFTTIADGDATFGSGVPTLALASSLAPGEIAQFAGVSDAALETIQDALPATFRTNFGLVETAGEPTTIRVVVRFAIPQTTNQAIVEASQNYDLSPNQFLLLGNLVRTILGAENEELVGDVSNIQVRFEHVGGSGRAAVFTSSVDNGTGDSILRVE